MYNEKNKQRFIDSMDNYMLSSIAELLFNKIEVIENKLKKDISKFNLFELLNLFKYLCNHNNVYNKGTLSSYRIILIDYINYTNKSDTTTLEMIGIDAIMSSLKELGKDIVSDYLFTKTYFDEIIINTVKKYSYSEWNIALLQCVFNGIMGTRYRNIINLKTSDINGNVVKINDTELTVSDDCIKSLNIVSNLKFDYKLNTLDFYDDVNSVFKLHAYRKSVYEDTMYSRCMYFFTIQLKKMMNSKKIKAKSFYKSGLIYYVISNALENGCNLVKDFTDDNHANDKLYEQLINEFGSSMPISTFKYKFKTFIINNY